MLLLVIIVVVILVVVGIVLLKKSHTAEHWGAHDKEALAYFRKVYPTGDSFLPLNFLYACAPESIKKHYAPFFDPDLSKNYAPPPLFATWRPIWYPADTYSVNFYPPNKWWTYFDPLSFASGEVVEGLHVRDDNPLYPVYGYWVYVSKGTGVFYNLGKTLAARNKIDSLHLLGMTSAAIARAIIDKHYWRNPDSPNLAIVDVARRFCGSNDLEKARAMVNYIVDVGQDYEVDRINNSADFDDLITTMAKEQGYDSVQFQVQANGLGGWGHEMVYVSPTPLLKQKEITWAGWKDMRRLMSVRAAPCGCLAPCTPVLSEDRQVVTCAEQNLSLECLGGKPTNYYPL